MIALKVIGIYFVVMSVLLYAAAKIEDKFDL